MISNESKYEFNSCISNDNEQDYRDSHAHMVHLFNKLIELGLLFSILSKIWEDTDGSGKQYICALAIYLMSVL